MDDRPPPDPAKLLGQFKDWKTGEELPGRTMSYLKTGGLLDVLEAAGDHEDHGPAIAAMLEAWAPWEKAKAMPADVLSAIDELGLATVLESLVPAS